MARSNTRPQDQKVYNPSPFDVPQGAVHRFPENQLVRFMPCGLVPSRTSALGFWIKYKKPGTHTNEIKLIKKTQGWLIVDCPDRILMITKRAMDSDVDRPLDMKWDRFISLSQTHNTGDNLSYDRYMTNPHALSKEDMAMRHRCGGKLGSSDLVHMSDSGGFQLRSGLTEWVDPMHLAQHYSDNVDEGMPLDIPGVGTKEEIFLACAKVQNLNSKLLKENTPEDVRLATIVHGSTISEMKKYRRIIEDYDAEWWQCAIPSSMNLPALQQLDRMVFLMSTGEQYSHYHMLGLFNSAVTFAVTRLAHKMLKAGRKILITSDSSASYYSAGRREVHSQFLHYKPTERNAIGMVTPGGAVANPNNLLQCGCTVCSNIKYAGVLTHVGCEETKLLLADHNNNEFIRYVAQIDYYAQHLDDNQYKELVISQLRGGHQQQTQLCLDYIDVVMQDGWLTAHNKFKHLIHAMFSKTEPDMYGEEQVPIPKTELNRRIGKAAKSYLRYHRTGKAPELSK